MKLEYIEWRLFKYGRWGSAENEFNDINNVNIKKYIFFFFKERGSII